MSDDNIKMELGVDVQTTGVNKLDNLERTVQRLNKQIDNLNAKAKAIAGVDASAGRLGRNVGQDRDAARTARAALEIDRDALRVLKMRMGYESRIRSDALIAVERERRATERLYREQLSFSSRMSRQRLTEERAVQREIERTGRARIAEDRRADREQSRNRRDAARHLGEASRRGRDSYNTLTRTPAAAAAASAAATGALARRAVGAEIDIDAAEINASIYGGLNKQAARDLRDKWATPLSEQLGVGTAKLLTAYVDALKIGIPKAGAEKFSELSTKVSEAWLVPFEKVTDTLGTINTIITSKGEKFSIDRLKSVANTLQYLAAKQSTTPEKLINFLERGAGAAQVLGMSQEAGLAFGSASTSLGNQAGQSGRLFDYIASRLIEIPKLIKGHGEQAHEARNLVKALGYGSAEAMERQRLADPDAFLPDFMARFHAIRDPKKRGRSMRFFTGREWLGEFGRMVEGADTYKEAVKLQQEAKTFDAIEDVWTKHKQKLSVILKRIRAGFVNLLGEVGKVFSPILNDFADYFLAWSRKLSGGGITERVKAVIDGFVEGLGFHNIPDLLKGIFGAPGDGSAGSVEQFKATAKAFAEGVREVFGVVRSVVGMLTGGSSEVVAKWVGRVFALSFALMALSPVLSILGGLVGLLASLVAVGRAAGSFLAMGAGAAGTAGAAGAAGAGAAGALAGVARVLSRGLLLGLAAEIGSNCGEISTLILAAVRPIWESIRDGIARAFSADGLKAGGKALLDEIIPAPIQRWLNGDVKSQTEGTWQDPPVRKSLQSMGGTDGQTRRDLNRIEENTRDGARFQRQSYELQDDGGSFKGLIHRASIGGVAGQAAVQLRALGLGTGIGAGVGGLGGGGGLGVGSGGGLGGSTPGEALSGVTGMRRRGIIGGGGSSSAGGGSSGSVDLGSGVTGPRMAGDVATRAKVAYDFFRAKGLSHEAAAGILASMKQESNFTPTARGDGGRAHGLFQHHPDRRAAILRGAGVNMSTASYQQQLEGTWWEMHHGDAGAQRALRILKTPGITARQAGAAFVQHFERPARDERASRGALAEGFARQFGGISAPARDAAADVGRLREIGDGMRTGGWRKATPSSQPAPTPSRAITGPPAPPPRPSGLGHSAPMRSTSLGGSGGGGGTTVNAPIQINGANQSPDEIASAVQRKMHEVMNRRTHDYDAHLG